MTNDAPTDRYVDLLAAVVRRARLDAQNHAICSNDNPARHCREAAAFLAWAERELAPVAESQPLGQIIEVRY